MTPNSTRRPKVFCIGFQKTGTTSLATALYTLGYNVTGFFGAHDRQIGSKVYDMAYELADRFDAVQDMPWPVLYRQLDERYPGSKFVLTVRPTDSWIRSVVGHFKAQYIATHDWVYGVGIARGNEDVFIERYERHNRQVVEYFNDRPDDLLVLDLRRSNGWAELCAFLGMEVPSLPFPVSNTAEAKSKQIVSRGMRYMKRRFLPWSRGAALNNMPRGVSAAFARDISHYHWSVSDSLVEAAGRLSDEDFEAPFTGPGSSVRDQVAAQLEAERAALSRLQGIPVTGAAVAPMTKSELLREWRELRSPFRAYVASLSGADCTERVAGDGAYIWEVLVDLVTGGVERRCKLREVVRALGVDVGDESFIDFFRGSREPASADAAIATLGER